jgi:hypothetical protein
MLLEKMLKICMVLLLIQLGLIRASEVSMDILMPHVVPKQVSQCFSVILANSDL